MKKIYIIFLAVFTLSSFSTIVDNSAEYLNNHIPTPITPASAMMTCTPTPIPLIEDFSGGVPPIGWTVINPDGSEGWESTSTTGSDGNPTLVARMDNYQYNSPGQLDELIVPCVDISTITNPELHFDVAYAPFSATNFERLHIEFSTDCGGTFAATTYSKEHLDLATTGYQGNGWGPQAAGDWRAEVVDLTPYKSTQTIFKFIQTAGYGNGLFIDNVQIKTDDPPVAAFTPSQNISCLGENVIFTDESLEAPNSWTWSFTPNTVTFQNGTTANSQHPEVSFDALGAYNVMLTVTNPNGNNSITQISHVVGTAIVPLLEEFTGGVPPTNWAVVNPDGLEGWELTNTTGSDGNPTQVARMDNYQYNHPGQLDELVMPSVDLSLITNPQLCFDVAYAPFNATNFERLHIEASTNCGNAFVPTTYDKSHLDLATTAYQGNGWGPQAAGDWRAETMDLTPYKSTNTVLKFIQTAGYGNGLFIDNVRIKTNDPPVANYTPAYGVSCVGTTVNFTDISMEAPTTWAWSFAPNTVTFQNGTTANSQHPQVSFDAVGQYSVMLTVTNLNGNNTITQTHDVVGTGIVPLQEDFSGGVPPTNWAVVNSDGLEGWELTTTTGSDGNMTQVARMDNYQYNHPGQLDELVLPSVDISAMIQPTLCFDVAYAPFGPNNFERLHIEFSTDCGGTFAPTTYDKSHLDLATTGYQGNGWAPQAAGDWRAEVVDLTPYQGTNTILKFIQTAGYGNGLFIDNIRIKDAAATYIQVKAILQGSHNGTDMNTNMQAASLIPLTNPYGLSESVVTIPANVVDWVKIEIREAGNSANIVACRAAFLRNDGQVIDLNGSTELAFTNLAAASGYVAIRHRNHLGVMTSGAINF